MEYFTLNTNEKIPVIGEGTFLFTPDEAESAVLTALEQGYRLIDTANYYMNEKAVGRAMKKSSLERSEIYLSTKLWPSEYGQASQAIDETLERLGTDYLDLLFLHQPVGNYLAAYQAMIEAVAAGKVKSLGLSNFSQNKIGELIEKTGVAPAVVQVEAHPYANQTALKEFLAPYNTKVMAWFPLGHGDKSLLNEQLFSDLAAKYHKTNVQIILRWHTQVGNIVIPGSKNPVHIAENLDIFDFELSPAELAEIKKLDVNKTYYVQTEEKLNEYLHLKQDYSKQK